MSNILNSIIANQPIHPVKQAPSSVFTIDTKGKIQPMEDKGKLLPSRIFGSPVEYAKDLKKDILNIGKAAKGQANDHELGRINDLAMKLGSLGLATYLFVRNPLKLSKAMEFIGFGTFFASMALWPKLAIQAPLKARTGVDIHQKYIDSQGRKKMLHQDPQYDLTDLYSREDLDKMGKKLGVSENLPDRDSFIKQRAKKTAVQGNTLWMMTAGVATPVMSALACNALEQPLTDIIEKADMVSSSIQIERGASKGLFAKIKQQMAEKSLNRFLIQNSDRELSPELITELANKLGSKANSASFIDALKQQISLLQKSAKLDESSIREALKGIIKPEIFESLTEEQRNTLSKAIESGSLKQITSTLTAAASGAEKTSHAYKELSNNIFKALKGKQQQTPKLSQISDDIKTLFRPVYKFSSEKSLLDKLIRTRVEDNAESYITNQWKRFGDKLIKSLKLSSKDLKALSQGDTGVLLKNIDKVASDEQAYTKLINELMKLINDYETKTGSGFTEKVSQKAQSICSSASQELQNGGFSAVANTIKSNAAAGTIENAVKVNTAERILGARSSIYRLLEFLDVAKALKNIDYSTADVDKNKILKVCREVLLNATTTDHIEKLTSANFGLTSKEYELVMQALNSDSGIQKIIEKSLSGLPEEEAKKKAAEMVSGLQSYKADFKKLIANWRNGMKPELAERVLENGVEQSANAVQRNNIVGKPVDSLFQEVAKRTYNSQKWMKIFGGTMAVLTIATLLIGLTLGRKSKMEKQVEAESSKVNG